MPPAKTVIWDTHQLLSSTVWVWLFSFPAFNSRCSPGLPSFSIQPHTELVTKCQPVSGDSTCYSLQWQRYEIPHGSYGGSQRFPHLHLSGYQLSSAGAHWMPPTPPGYKPVMRWMLSSSAPQDPPSGEHGWPLLRIPKRMVQQAAEE